MSLEDDILNAVKDLIKRSKEVVTYAGKVSEVNTTTGVVSVIVDGATGVTPCLPLIHMDLAAGQRVAVMKAAGTFYIIGIMGMKRVVHLPSYTGSHPTGTVAGDMWYRSDLNHAYININGTPTQADN